MNEQVLAAVIEDLARRTRAALSPIADRVKELEAMPRFDAKAIAEELRPMIAEMVKAAAAEIKPPKGDQGERGEPGPPPDPALIEERVKLAHAQWAVDFERHAAGVLLAAIEKMPRPKDGRDGVSISDLAIEFDGERTVTVLARGADGSEVRSNPMKMPAQIYRGVFSEGKSYEAHDVVTFGGSAWIALKDEPNCRPGDAGTDSSWRLMVKRGRDAKTPATYGVTQ